MAEAGLLRTPGPVRTFTVVNFTSTVGTGLWLSGSALFFTRGLGLGVGEVGLGLSAATLVGAWLLAGDAEIALPGEAFDDYLDSVGAKIRKRVRRDRMLFTRAGYHLDVQPLGTNCQRAGALVANLERHHGNEVDPLHIADLLFAQAEDIGSDAHAHLCQTEAGATVGIGVSYTTATQVVSRACGFDYGQLRAAAEYFELAYYAPIEQAYRIGASRLLLGLGTYETKIRRGARIRLRWALRSGASPTGHTGTQVQRHNEARWRHLVEREGLRPEAILDRSQPEL